MSSKLSFLTSGTTWLAIAAGVVTFGNQILPIVPTTWANILTFIIGVAALYVHSNQIKAGRVASGI